MSIRFIPRSQSIRGSAMGVVLLAAIIGIFVLAYVLRDQTRTEQSRQLQVDLSDPQTALERYFMIRQGEIGLNDEEWRLLYDFQSKDDQIWFDNNYNLIATLNPRMEGIVAMGVTPREREYGAVEYLTQFGPMAPRPVIVNITVNGRYAVAYVHPPGNIQNLKEIFLIQEDNQWKIRRWGNRRDYGTVIDTLYEAKRWDDIPLNDDELLYDEDPAGYFSKIRRNLLIESGVDPDSDPQVDIGEIGQ